MSARRPSLLVALSSADDLDSLKARFMLESLRRLVEDFEIELAIDDGEPRNVEIASDFCARHGMTCHAGPASRASSAHSWGNTGLSGLLRIRAWDLVMAVGWANGANNEAILAEPARSAVAYLPLYRPDCTNALDDDGRGFVERVHRELLLRADVCLCVSPFECHLLCAVLPDAGPRCAVIPPGVDVSRFPAGSAERAADLLFVGDPLDPGNGFERALGVLGRVRDRGVDARLVVAGNEDDAVAAGALPVVTLGRLSEDALAQAYREAAVLLLLSDFELFATPIIEALASATPVVTTARSGPASLLSADDGVRLVDPDDLDTVGGLVVTLIEDGPPQRAALSQRREDLAARFDWNASSGRLRAHLLAAWGHRVRSTMAATASDA
jgi:glycosyltransferase involved in cell wall biosynthesis